MGAKITCQKLRRWKQADVGWFRDMDYRCFPTDTPFWNDKTYHWWVVYEGTVPVAYAALSTEPNSVVRFTRCGVLPEHRGRGYQRILIKARITWCRRNGIKLIKTYTDPVNTKSTQNLKAAGFRSRRSGKWINFRKDLP